MPLGVGVAVWLSFGAGWMPRDPVASAQIPVPSASQSSSQPVFRLGTAAGPFGWSTAIGDFNTDGTPDVAIADRVSGSIGASAYRIQFSVSGRESRTFAFESQQDALTVRASDIDHDNDFDVVVSGALSHEIVGVWLNDGRGGFEAAATWPSPPASNRAQSVHAEEPSVNPSSAGLVPRRLTEGLPLLVRGTPAISRRPLSPVQPVRFQPALLSAAAASRAPPSRFAHSLLF